MDNSLWKICACGSAWLVLTRSLFGVVVLAVTTVALMSESANAQRWYGNAQVSVSDTRNDAGELPKSGRLNANTFLNVEDVLFYKNRIRLAGKFDSAPSERLR